MSGECYESITLDFMMKKMQADPSVCMITSGTPTVLGFTEEMRKKAGRQFIEEQTAALISELETFLKSSSKPLARAVMAKLVTMVPLFIRDYNQLEEYIQNSLSSCSDVAEKLACIEIIRSL